jgi:hypothetical protein
MLDRKFANLALTLVLVLACNGPVLSQSYQPAAPNAKSPLGTNLGPIIDWTNEWPFMDAFRASRPWVSGAGFTWDDGRPISTDANGWVTSLLPSQIARAVVLTGDHTPAGTYVVLYDGAGAIEYSGGATYDAGASAPGRHVVTVGTVKPGFMLYITATTEGNPIRNIRVIMPGGTCSGDAFRYAKDTSGCAGAGFYVSFESVYATSVFHPKFLERIRTYRSLRFMDWGQTNGSAQTTWADRPKLTDARWSTSKGAPVEVMVDLANRVGAYGWFNIPHLADDDYVRQFARLVKQRLRFDLKAYVEYTNEVWNSFFVQAAYAQAQGVAQNLAVDLGQAKLFWYSKRSVQVFDIWSDEFADPKRLVRVMGAQAASTWTSTQVLTYQNASKKTDALAIAPYFGAYLGNPTEQTRVRAMNLTALFVELGNVALPQVISLMRDQATTAASNGVALIAYEGGQHLTGNRGVENDDVINALFDNANRDARMGTIYRRYLEGWKSAGAGIMHHYVNAGPYNKWGRWGSLEYSDQPRTSSPKYDALQNYITQNPILQ